MARPFAKFHALFLLSIGLSSLTLADDFIRQRMEAWNAGYPASIAGRAIGQPILLNQLYLENGYEPFWLNQHNLGNAAVELLQVINTIDQDGLQAADYHGDVLLTLQNPTAPNISVETDILFSEAFLLLAQHLLLGKVNPESLTPEWKASKKGIDLTLIWQRFKNGEPPAAILDSLRPNQERYRRLKKALATLRANQPENWPQLSPTPAIKESSNDGRIPSIRQRLHWWQQVNQITQPASEDPATARSTTADNDNDSDIYDPALKKAVMDFQYRHGLDVDGVIGKATLQALNRSPQARVDEIRVNLERWRWLEKELGQRFIVVNIADFDLRIYDNNDVIFQKPVIVGKSYRKSPVFSDQIKYLVFNPTWTVPHKLAIEDKLPEIRKDPDYLKRFGFQLYQMGTSTPVDPETIDWANTKRRNFAFRMVQSPGPLNALGQVKFMFPNPYDVYLHDTANKELFAKSERAFSSGCIRVSDPLELARILLEPQGWNQQRITSLVDEGKTVTVYLNKPVPIHIEYWTAWVDRNGNLNFRTDIYDRDPAVLAALNATQ